MKPIFIHLAAQCYYTSPEPPTGNEQSLVSITSTSTFYDINILRDV